MVTTARAWNGAYCRIFRLSKIARERLTRLRDYMAAQDEDGVEFDMAVPADIVVRAVEKKYELCNTAACFGGEVQLLKAGVPADGFISEKKFREIVSLSDCEWDQMAADSARWLYLHESMATALFHLHEWPLRLRKLYNAVEDQDEDYEHLTKRQIGVAFLTDILDGKIEFREACLPGENLRDRWIDHTQKEED
jgi:hypothetical protein